MCGISGFLLATADWENSELVSAVVRQSNAIAHRGPDDTGSWVDPRAGVALGHRRLSIVDLSPSGHQPMVSHCERFVIVFNGEIYNHRELRSELTRDARVTRWRGHSDTEVLLEAIAHWGLAGALERCVGMFAFAVWDRQLRRLVLGRDRLGEKPLYYGYAGSTLVFASELKGLTAHPSWAGEIDREALTAYLRFAYVPHRQSIYAGVRKLLPGTTVGFDHDAVSRRALPDPVYYWSASAVVQQALHDPFRGSEDDAVAELDRLLRQSVAGQMVADVPLGAFLSGGIDSSTVVALMQAQSTRPVRTFTIGFHEAGYDEAEHAKAVASHLGTDHTELYVSSQQALDVIPRLPSLYDEPFADSSQVPTFLVAELARRHVTVSLSGDGGDELFGGYNRYFVARRVWGRLSRVPVGVRRAFAELMLSASPGRWDALYGVIERTLPRRKRLQLPGDKVHKLARMLALPDAESFYRSLVSQIGEPGSVAVDSRECSTALDVPEPWFQSVSLTERMMFLDLVSYLPDDILVKVDRAAMAVSLETRVPLLDHRVVEFAWRLPLAMKVRGGTGKHLLRRVLDRYVPRAMIERPKMGFGVPLDRWLRGPLRDWAESLLDPVAIRADGYLRHEPVTQRWNEHLSGRRNWSYWLWTVLMFQAWLRHSPGLPVGTAGNAAEHRRRVAV